MVDIISEEKREQGVAVLAFIFILFS